MGNLWRMTCGGTGCVFISAKTLDLSQSLGKFSLRHSAKRLRPFLPSLAFKPSKNGAPRSQARGSLARFHVNDGDQEPRICTESRVSPSKQIQPLKTFHIITHPISPRSTSAQPEQETPSRLGWHPRFPTPDYDALLCEPRAWPDSPLDPRNSAIFQDRGVEWSWSCFIAKCTASSGGWEDDDIAPNLAVFPPD